MSSAPVLDSLGIGAERWYRKKFKQSISLSLIQPEFINLCFWYLPPSLRGQEGCSDYCEKLGKVAPVIKERMMKNGSMMVSYQPHGNKPNFFRQVVTNPAVTRKDLDFFLNEIERLGRDL